MKKRYALSILWIKRDIRLADNQALCQALMHSEQVLPLFLFEPSITSAADYSDFHRYACAHALLELRGELQRREAGIWIQEAEFEEAIDTISSLAPVEAIFSHEETGLSFTFERDKRVAKYLESKKIVWTEIPTNGVVRRLRDRSKRSAIWNRRMAEPIRPAPHVVPLNSRIVSACNNAPCVPLQQLTKWGTHAKLQAVSESAGHKTLESFLGGRGIAYSGGISSPNTAFSAGSRLSPHLAWGCLSLRQIVSAKEDRKEELRGSKTEEAKQWRKSLNAFSSRLHWHDHFIQRLESQSDMEFHPLNPAYEALPYIDDSERLERWLAGATGVPMVDASMRCLASEGFLNFRMRAMIVSYACHVLHLSWREIMHPLARLFLDYEPGIHVSQIQMQAGVVGINTLRVYNPDKQMLDHDPGLQFVRSWIHELRDQRKESIFDYRNQRLSAYPTPMVDYKEASAEMKAAYYSIKRSAAAKTESRRVLEKHGSRKRQRATRKKQSEQLRLFEVETV